ncbi:peptidase [Actinoplanes sp. GCM10030250]|uniref:peptidase n=1 Tax=Actinoplanes sp. GCM10030250 TaxID=3273376 RepID=UPI00360DCC59
MMRPANARSTAALIAAALSPLFATPALASPAPATPAPATPAPAEISSAGTSFLTAVPISPDQPVQVGAVTGDYLYWSFSAEAGRRPELAINVALPPAADRSGAQSWTVEVFDGLRRRQACVSGEQSPVAAPADNAVTLGCRLRQVRSWAEPWDGDPLPGTYYVRLSTTEMPEKDLGLPVEVGLTLTTPTGDTGADQGVLAAPLVPDNRPGKVLTTPEPFTPEEESSFSADWLPDFSSRWIWTAGGGVLAALTGLLGFSWTRRRPT